MASAQNEVYHLIYWPGIPGRGEHARLALEEAGATYTDTAHAEGGVKEVISYVSGAQPAPDADPRNPPVLAPPALKHGDLTISQTPNILLYLGQQLGLAPSVADGAGLGGALQVNGLALTALDGLSNEPHDCHHPIATGQYYEDQKPEAARRSKDYVTQRLPKFLAYFQRVLESKASGDGPWLYQGRLTYADLVLFQCLDGLKFMFPKATGKFEKEGKYAKVFDLYHAVQERPNIKAYLASERRQKYSNGIYRYYEELDFEP